MDEQQNRPISFVGMNINQVKSQLEAQLSQQTSPISRNAILKQTQRIKKELQELEHYKEEVLPDHLRFRLETLANELEQIKSPLVLPPPTSRRSKYQSEKKRNPDIDFATEIGQGLLVEVRKLQNTIQEKEETIKRLEAAKIENERQVESAQRQLKQREEIEERLKEENWNLEVANQELLGHLTESNQTIAKHNTDYVRLIKQVKDQSEHMEIMKAQDEKKDSVIEAMKARHEQEMHGMRRHAANSQRENAQIQQQVDTLQTELKICHAKLAIKMTVNSRAEPVESQMGPADEKENKEKAQPASQSTHRNNQMETETLKQSLAHAHRIISNLRGSAHKEKLERFELKKMLSDSQETIEQLQRDAPVGRTTKKKHTKKRRTGISRKPRGVSSESSDNLSIKSSDDEEAIHELGLGFGTPLKPLSSELESKVQVIDAGVNTSLELSVAALDGHSIEPVMDNKISPDEARQWVDAAVEDALRAYRLETEKLTVSRSHFDQAMAEAKEAQDMLNGQIKESVTLSVAKQWVAEAVAKEKEIAKEEIERLMRERMTVLAEAVESALSKERQASSTRHTEELEKVRSEMIPKSTVHELVAEAVEKATIEEKEKSAMAMEEKVKDMIPRSKVNELVAEAAKNAAEEQYSVASQESMPISKARVLIAEAREEGAQTEKAENAKREDVVPKSRVDKLVAEAVLLETEKITLTMIHKSEAERKVSEARLEVQQEMAAALEKMREREEKAELEFDSRIRRLEKETDEMMMTKVEAQNKIEEARSESTQKMEQEIAFKIKAMEQAQEEMRIEFEEKVNQAKQETIKSMKMESESAVLEAVEKTRSGMMDIEEAQLLVAQGVSKERQVMTEKHQQELHVLLEAQSSHTTEKEALNNCIQSYKKESEETNQRMKNMLTKESTDVLVKRAVADALENNERKHKETMSRMVTKVDVEIMIKKAVSRALEQERKEVAEATMLMISKAEAEALAKVAAADAIVNERQAQAAREKELVSKEESDKLSKQAVQDALEKEKLKHAEILAKERKIAKEKEEKMISKEQAQVMADEAVRIALEKEETEVENISPRSPPIVPERSISTSRLTPPSIQVIPTPSISTPSTPSKNRLRLSKSVSSLRRKASSDSISTKATSRPSTESHKGFGSLRILENTTYSRKIGSKNSLASKQGSTLSLSTTMSEDSYPTLNLPSEDNMSMFADSQGNTDMDVISSITQTMIGEWMMKHTRRYVGSGISEHKHKRFFWVHPYTRSLYWSSIEPGVDGSESRAKSAFIESVVVVSNQGQASPKSLLIRTPKRDLKITAPTMERHEIWHKSMMFLVGRNHSSTEPDNTAQSVKDMIPSIDMNQYDSDESEDINIRQCCDGKHDVSTLSTKKHSHS